MAGAGCDRALGQQTLSAQAMNGPSPDGILAGMAARPSGHGVISDAAAACEVAGLP